jgi:hypothetical protein
MIAIEDLVGLNPTPDPMTSAEEHDRSNHFDIEAATNDDLARELVVVRLINFAADSAWHHERETRITEEIQRRRRPRATRG